MFCNDEEISLNLRVLVAQVGVSILGKMLKITRLPAMSLLVMSCSALVVSENFGNALPVAGNLPLTETGLPPNVTVAPDFLTAFLAAFFLPDFLTAFLKDFFFVFFAFFFFNAMMSPNREVVVK